MMIKRISGKFSIKDGLDPSSIAWGTFTDSLNITGTDRPLHVLFVRYANYNGRNRLLGISYTVYGLILRKDGVFWI